MNVHVIVHVNVHVTRRFSMATMAELARTLGVSVQTISAVVNNKPGISEETRARVRAVMDEFDYHPNQHARTLRGHKNPMVGVIIPTITNPYFPELVRGVEDAARNSGYGIFLCNDDYDFDKIISYFSFIRTNRASGLIAAPGLVDRTLESEVERHLIAFAKQHIPVALLGGRRPDLPVTSIVCDAREGIAEAARHLLDLRHRRIGVIAPPEGLGIHDERINQFVEAFAALGHVVAPELIVPGGFEIDDGAPAARRLMSLTEPPTAIVAANDLVAIGVISALNEMGKRVPDDLSVLGYDDIAFARVFQPPITTIAQPIYELGAAAMSAILNADDEPLTTGKVITLSARLVKRRSTAQAR